MRGNWYIVVLFYLAGYLPTVIGFLTIIIFSCIINLFKNRLLFFLSFSFYLLSLFLSPSLNLSEEIQFEEPIKYEGQIKIASNPVDKTDYIEVIGIDEIRDERLLFRLHPEQSFQTVKHGARCVVKGMMRLPREATNEGQFNYRQYLNAQGIFYEVNDGAVISCEGRSYLSYLHDLRSTWQSKAETLLSEQSFPWVNAIVFGDRSHIDEGTIELYEFWNISHLLAISGLHVGLTLAIFYFIFQRVFKWTKETTGIVMLLIIPIYIVVAGANPPVLRAGLMTLIIILWQMFKKKLDSIDVISIVCIFLLIQQPYLLYQVSFQFSFVVAFSLILSSQLFKNDNAIMLSIKISMISQLVILPLQFEYFYFTNILSFLLNLIYVPYYTIFVIPVSLILLLTMYVDSFLTIFETVFIFVNEWMILFIKWLGEPSFAIWVFGKPSLLATIGYYLCFILFMKYWDLQKLKKAAFYATLSIAVFIVEGYLPYFDSTYSITMLDVGQSEAIVVELPYRNGVFLIDAGEELWFDGEHDHRNFNNVIKPYFWSKGIQQIDGFFISHFDFDHSGSFEEVINEFKPNYVFTHPYFNGEINDKTNHIKLSGGMSLSLNSAKIDVLSPRQSETSIDDENDLSVVFMMDVDGFKTLFTGDISKEVEERLVKENVLSPIHLLKIAHHGSQSSTSLLLLEETKPQLALISVGNNNLYNHPHQDVIGRLENHGISYFRSDEDGAIKVKIKNGQLTVAPFKP